MIRVICKITDLLNHKTRITRIICDSQKCEYFDFHDSQSSCKSYDSHNPAYRSVRIWYTRILVELDNNLENWTSFSKIQRNIF